MKLIAKTIIFAWALVTLWYGYTRMLAEPSIQTISIFGWLLVAVVLLGIRSSESFWVRFVVLVPVVIFAIGSCLSLSAV